MAMMFKVRSHKSAARRCVVGSSLEQICSKAIKILSLNNDPAHIVLEEDGTPIDDNEILPHIKGSVLMILSGQETWETATGATDTSNNPHTQINSAIQKKSPCKSSPSIMPEARWTETPETPDKILEQVTEPEQTPRSRKSYQSRLQLPSFDSATAAALKDGNSHRVWPMVVETLCSYYVDMADRMNNQGDYRQVGKELILKYPCLVRDGAHPWSTLMKSVSTKLRNTRLRLKRKSMDPQESPLAAKRVHLSMRSTPARVLLPENECEKHVKEMRAEMCKASCDRNLPHMLLLLKETFENRRDFIAAEEQQKKACILAELLDKYPVLQCGNAVWEEFRLVLNKSSSEMDHLLTSFRELVDKVEDDMPLSKQKEGEMKCLAVIRHLESKVGYKAGRGPKSQSAFIIVEDVSEDDIEKLQKTNPGEAPKLVTFTSDHTIEQIVMCGDTRVIYFNDMEKAILSLIGAYYVFDVEYPRVYSQILGFLQQVILKQPFSGPHVVTKAFKDELAKLL